MCGSLVAIFASGSTGVYAGDGWACAQHHTGRVGMDGADPTVEGPYTLVAGDLVLLPRPVVAALLTHLSPFEESCFTDGQLHRMRIELRNALGSTS